MGQIRVLPPALVSRIAAGECIERPASVIKELVENALDAGAGRIDIAVEDGGRALIRVADDGRGMDPDDLALSVTQHATSKLGSDDDLFHIQSLGFRGEALASIAAVARVRIVSRRPDADVAHELCVEGGQPAGPPRPCAAPPGTKVEVRDLFYAVPARRKFLRTTQTELGHISEQVARLALPSPGLEFTLKHNERVVQRLPACGEHRARIADLFGPQLAEVLLPIRRTGTGVVVEGLVAPPAESRGSGRWEYVFLNGRFVRDRFVSHAVREAYRSLIDPSRFPVVFLFITVDPAEVDVNVHPMKLEVRWRDANYVHGQVLAALREKFLATNLDHRLDAGAPERDAAAQRERVREAMVAFFTRAGAAGAPDTGQRPVPHPVAADLPVGRPLDLPVIPPHLDSAGAASPAQTYAPSAAPPEATAGTAGESPSLATGPLCPQVPPARALQVHNAYLVVESEDGVLIIDQHALHERILYEELRRRLTEHRLESQRLLLPEVVAVAPDRIEALDLHADTLARLGLELTPAGPHSVALQAFPSLLLERVDPARFVRDLLDLLAGRAAADPELLVHAVLDMMACKAAVKAGDPLSMAEIAALLERRAIAERSSHCPHGRPTTLRLTLRDLERQFHRH